MKAIETDLKVVDSVFKFVTELENWHPEDPDGKVIHIQEFIHNLNKQQRAKDKQAVDKKVKLIKNKIVHFFDYSETNDAGCFIIGQDELDELLVELKAIDKIYKEVKP